MFIYDPSFSYKNYLELLRKDETVYNNERRNVLKLNKKVFEKITDKEILKSLGIIIKDNSIMLDFDFLKPKGDEPEENVDDLLLTGNLPDTITVEDNFIEISFDQDSYFSLEGKLLARFDWDLVHILSMNYCFKDHLREMDPCYEFIASPRLKAFREAYFQKVYRIAYEELESVFIVGIETFNLRTRWSVCFLKGLMLLGHKGCDIGLINIAQAQELFEIASKYAGKDYPEEQALSTFCASLAAYYNGKFKEAFEMSEKLTSNLIGSHIDYFNAKFALLLDRQEQAAVFLEKAANADVFFLIKAGSDTDFTDNYIFMTDFLNDYAEKVYLSFKDKKALLDKSVSLIPMKSLPEDISDMIVKYGRVTEDTKLMDVISYIEEIDKILSIKFLITEFQPEIVKNVKVSYKKEEVYEEKVIDRPGGFLRKTIFHMEKKTRIITSYDECNVNIAVMDKKLKVCTDTKETIFRFHRVEGKTFEMGYDKGFDDEKPVHLVTVGDFYVGKYPVTQEQWVAVMGNNPSAFQGKDLPVENLNWYDCIVFCNKMSMLEGLTPCYMKNLKTDPAKWGRIPESRAKDWDEIIFDFLADGYRLPTEAEWEYMAKGGIADQGLMFAGSNDVEEAGWYHYNSDKKTHPIGQKCPNELGLYDVSGNVWEWCWDWYGEYQAAKQDNPRGIEKGQYRVLRGGSWRSDKERLQTVFRDYHNPSLRYAFLGFRLVKKATD